MVTRRRTPRFREADEPAGAAFDRVGARAWSLARWIVDDDELAADVLVAAFGFPRSGSGDDAALLCDVRRRAVAAASSRNAAPADHRASPGVDPPPTSVPGAVAALPEPQRAVIELAVFGQLDAAAIASGLDLPHGEVLSLIACAMRTLGPLLRHPNGSGGPLGVFDRGRIPA